MANPLIPPRHYARRIAPALLCAWCAIGAGLLLLWAALAGRILA